MTDAGFDVVRVRYHGWYARDGAWWEAYNRLRAPGANKPIDTFEDVGYQ